MKVADNLDMHKIWDEFEFRQDGTIQFGVTCHCVPKASHIRLMSFMPLIAGTLGLR